MHLVPAAAAVRPGTSSQRANQDQEKNKKSYIAPAIISSIQDTEACRVCRHRYVLLDMFYTYSTLHGFFISLLFLCHISCPLSLVSCPFPLLLLLGFGLDW